jgi:spermidine synthase
MSKKIEILKQNGCHFVWIDKKLWMWDIPLERKLQKNVAKQAYGDVLVAGYGLGVVQKYLLQNKRVGRVLTLENSKEIIDACKKEFGKLHGEVILGNFLRFNSETKFDCVVGDIWAEIDSESLPVYKKFKKAAQKFLKPRGKIIAWGQDYFDYLIAEKK